MPSPDTLADVCKTYLTALQAQAKLANSVDEMSYRAQLDTFLRNSAAALGAQPDITHEPKLLDVGRPDFAFKDGLKEIGYVEAESVGADLKHLKGHAELQNNRFKANLHALVLTNHFDFELWIDNKLVRTARFTSPPTHGNVKVDAQGIEDWRSLFGTFLDEGVPEAKSASDVALQLAKRAGELKYAAVCLLSNTDSALQPFFNAYKQTLYPEMTLEQFADVYAQTLTYGFFLAWYEHDKGPFNRKAALDEIPETVPPIAALLDAGSGKKLPEAFKWIVDGICSDLNFTDKAAVLKPTPGKSDPITFFYETFLAAYDPRLRKQAGVYYTPDAVVEFIVRAVDDVLKGVFKIEEGLADDTVRLLDPAVGTATFLAHAYRHVYQTMADTNSLGQWPARAQNHLARHFFGFELLPAAYTLAHIKLRALLHELKAMLPMTQRLPIYLANTLSRDIPQAEKLPFQETLVEEAEHAARVKNSENILVVLGNPPYSGNSANPGKDKKGADTHIGALLKPYFSVDGAPLGERNPKWLQDDYVKFLRFAEDRIARNGSGVVAFITNHGYLDNPTFRGMRRHLMTTFDTIYVYDLHGNAKKKERSPDGGDDNNVFDIQQGVAVCILVKLPAENSVMS